MQAILNRSLSGIVGVAIVLTAGTCPAEDWPSYLHDNTRSGITSESLPLPMQEVWRYQAAHPPAPAWPAPAENDYWHNLRKLRSLVTYDRVYQVVVAEGAVFFGTSSDGKVYALDANTGEPRWSFFTGGPIRLAPVVAAGKVYVGADDGTVYCLDAQNGRLLWKFAAQEKQSYLPGNGRMISRWPIRAGLVVEAGTLYFGAGLFPKEGTYLFALDAETGDVTWKQSVRRSPQGYMLASSQRLYVPTGRTSPAVFSRTDGTFQGEFSSGGGAYALLTQDVLITGPGRDEKAISASDIKTKETIALFGGLRMVIQGKTAYMQSETQLSAFDRGRYLLLSREKNNLDKQRVEIEKRGKKLSNRTAEFKRLATELRQLKRRQGEIRKEQAACELWTVKLACPFSLVLAGETLFAGGENQVVALDCKDGKPLWHEAVDGKAYGLSIADGMLYVSTDKGVIHGFRHSRKGRSGQIQSVVAATGQDVGTDATLYQHAAEQILKETGIRQGYCLVLGCETGQLALELARQTDLQVVVLEADAAKVASARRLLDQAGYYGTRVAVHQRASDWSPADGDLADRLPYPDYFANLIVSEKTLLTGALPCSSLEAFRVLRPCGGILYIGQGQRDASKAEGLNEETLAEWVKPLALSEGVVRKDRGVWAVIERPALPGSGEWTQLYGDAGNTTCSEDMLRGPMRMQWYGEPGPRTIIDRHHRPMSPLYTNGRLFVSGNNRILAVDAYNGTPLWNLEVPYSRRIGVMKDCGQIVATDQSLLIASGGECWAVDSSDGSRLRTFKVPRVGSGRQEWGYLNYTDTSIIGSAQKWGASFTALAFHDDPDNGSAVLEGDFREVIVSRAVFSLDRTTAKRRWVYRHGAIMNSTFAMDNSHLYFVESSNPRIVKDPNGRVRIDKFCEQGLALVALDLSTGRPVWKRAIRLPFQHIMFLNCARNTLICSGTYNEKNHVHYGLFTFDASTGKDKWHTQYLAMDVRGNKLTGTDGSHGEQWQHPVINGSTVYSKPYAFDLETGEKKSYKWLRGGHGCGGVSSSANYLFGRGSNPRYYPITEDHSKGVQLTEVTRPGCWINIIPAGGLVLIPESSSGCTCGYAVQTSLAFAQKAYYGPPRFLTTTRRFQKPLAVKLASANGVGEIRYTLDGSPPTENSPPYSEPIRLAETTTVKARTYWGEGKSSEAAEARFVYGE